MGSLIDDIRKVLQGENKSVFIDQILKEQAFYDALSKAGLAVTVADPTERGRLQPFGVLSKVQKIDELTLLKTLEVLQEITLIKEIEKIESMPDSTPKGSEGTAFKQNTAGAGAWVSPTGFEDPDSKWTTEEGLYDNRILEGQGAVTDLVAFQWTSFVHVTIDAIRSNMLKIFLYLELVSMAYLDIDVYKDGTWAHVYEGATDSGWTTYTFAEGTVSKVRFRFYAEGDKSNAEFFMEAKLWQVPSTGGELVVKQLEKDRTISSLSENGFLTNFSTNVTADIKAPTTGYHLKVLAAFYYCPEDVKTELRFKEGGGLVLALPTMGAIGMNLISIAKPKGGESEALELFIDGTALCKGWVVTSQSLT